VTSQSGHQISEDFCNLINPNFHQKLNKNEKHIIEQTVKELVEVSESGCWFVVANNFLNSLHNNLGKKIIESTQKNVEIPKNHNYANIFTYIKNSIGKNLVSMTNHFCLKIRSHVKFD